jgi:alpha-galactosidase
MAEAQAWTAAHFSGASPAVPEAALVVYANNDPVQLNGRGGRPLRIAGKAYPHGLFCHAASKVAVRLPAPGKKFTATVGVDSNEQTRPGRGSIVFSVRVGQREAFCSPVLREGMPGIPVAVDLDGAKEFLLEVGDAGDGIGCDQAAWAEAQVVLADGKTLRLGDLPALGLHARKHASAAPFSFQYGGKPSSELLPAWKVQRASRRLDDRRTEHVVTYTDPATGLVVRCVGLEYHDFPTVEWTLHFKNTGKENTPILSEVEAVDLRIERFPWPSTDLSEFRLHHHTGSPCRPDDYAPHVAILKPRESKRLSAAGGRPTNSDLPYFNIELPTSEGLIVVVGWPGQWAAEFRRDEGAGLRVRAGQELTRFTLHPGEEVRTPLVALQFWKGDRIRAQNVWRRWMLAHNLPRPGGRLPPIQLAACSSHQFGEMIHANTENQKFFIDRYLEEKLRLDYWWMDAGWYVNKTGWPNTGTWEVDTNRFPGGLRPICDHAHARGVRTIVWFEPERVTAGTWLAQKHPEWVLGGAGGGLLNLGNPEARAWLTEHVDRLLTEQGIDLYRQDFNMDPLEFWRKNDAPDRQGITEIRHVEGYLAYWDELRRRHPNMLIDSCASGGRRNDLETLRRAVPLLRSDYIIEPVGNQAHTYGIAFWMPYYGTGSGAVDPYMLRSVMCPHFTACFDMRRKDLDYESIRRELGAWRRFAENFLGDYYPLTAWSLDPTAWIAWQFDRPEAGQGMIQAFRRAESPYEACRFRLCGLDPAARYLIRDVDRPETTERTGRELMDDGLLVSIPRQPWAAVLTYQRQ